ncbi:hypothetical protein [Chitinophaga caseinilytica]|uniref:Uncharacterized protein n=1 Tax=Chitinophaga caseinilytica TaxID=2267521 RepID=A0ABZ2Z836_9BACT
MKSISLVFFSFMLLLTSFRLPNAASTTTAARCGGYLRILNPSHGVNEPFIKKVTITDLDNVYPVEIYNIPSGTTSVLLPAILHTGTHYRIDFQLMPASATTNYGLLTMKEWDGTIFQSAEYLEGPGGIPTVSITTYVDCFTYDVSCQNY